MENLNQEVKFGRLSNRLRHELVKRYESEISDYMNEGFECDIIDIVDGTFRSAFGDGVIVVDFDMNDWTKTDILLEPLTVLSLVDSNLVPLLKSELLKLDMRVVGTNIYVNIVYCDHVINKGEVVNELDIDMDYLTDTLLDTIYLTKERLSDLQENEKPEDVGEIEAEIFFNDNGYKFIVEIVK